MTPPYGNDLSATCQYRPPLEHQSLVFFFFLFCFFKRWRTKGFYTNNPRLLTNTKRIQQPSFFLSHPLPPPHFLPKKASPIFSILLLFFFPFTSTVVGRRVLVGDCLCAFIRMAGIIPSYSGSVGSACINNNSLFFLFCARSILLFFSTFCKTHTIQRKMGPFLLIPHHILSIY